MKILGINDHHNSSVSYLEDGRLICAMQEERFTHKKNFWGMPRYSIQAALDYAEIKLDDIDLIVFAGQRQSGHRDFSRVEHMDLYKKVVQLDIIDRLRRRNNVSVKDIAKRKIYASLLKRMPKYFYGREIRKMKKERLELLFEYFPEAREVDIQFMDHHECHFAAANFGAGRPKARRLVFTNDGQGDLRCGSVYLVDENGEKHRLSSIDDVHSIAQLWALVTLIMGFVPNEHEYKLMGMAPYSSPKGRDEVARAFENLFIWNAEKGQFQLKNRNLVHSFYLQTLIEDINMIMKFRRFDEVCGGLQQFTEKVLTRWILHWIKKTGVHDICLSGGTFMNVKANMEIMKEQAVNSVFVFPSCGDETNAIGACYQSYYEKTGKYPEPLQHLYLGSLWEDTAIESAVDLLNKNAVHVEKYDDIEAKIAELLVEGKVVARFNGREEFGARALGNRSILANPNRWSAISEINDMIKNRDFWMPFACSILAEDQHRYIDNPGKNCGQYMIMCFEGGKEINDIIAGTHPRDKSIRPQIVSKEMAPDYHRLINEFKKRTNIGAVLNTSFNLHGYPLVHSPEDAIDVFKNSGLQYLALGSYLLTKKQDSGKL